MPYVIFLAVAASTVLGLVNGARAAEETRMLRRPAVSGDEVAFAYASDLWVVAREGGQARRLTATPTVETDPRFSPDGSLVAYTATVGGNTDVYVVPSAGGEPRRLTWHPGMDMVRGWTPDGERVIFASTRHTIPTPRVSSYARLWTIGLDGGLPEALPMPRAWTGALSPDGRYVAYEEIAVEFEVLEAQNQSAQWRRYRGGRTHPIRVMNLADYSEETLPWENSVDSDPMWIGSTIYFLSDRNGGVVNLFAYDTESGELAQLTHHEEDDIMNASAGPEAIVYEQGGAVHRVELRTGQARRLRIEAQGEFPWTRPGKRNVGDMIRNVALSPDGERLAIEARGDIFVMPAGSKSPGEPRNLTRSPAAHDRSPVWSPDGHELAWLSDGSGEYRLLIGDPAGRRSPREIPLPSKAWYSGSSWSPDGANLLLRDNHLNLWMVDLASGKAVRVATDRYEEPMRQIDDAAWSPDSRWIAWSRNGKNRLRSIYLYSLDERSTYRVTASEVDAVSPAFDANGRYLYFLASTDYGPNVAWYNTSSLQRPVTRTVQAAVLSAEGRSPLLPDGTQAADDEPGENAAEGPGVRIDTDGLSRRIVALDVPPADYAGLAAAGPGELVYGEHTAIGFTRLWAPSVQRLRRHDVETGKSTLLLEGIRSYALSADGRTLLYQAADGEQWGVVPAAEPSGVGDGVLEGTKLMAQVDPREEWRNIFRETWRLQRDYFYQPTMHGADWPAVYEKYVRLLPHVNHRADLGYLIAMTGGELSVGHSALSGPGDVPQDEPVEVGMLGADLAIEGGGYRIRRIYRGDPWKPDMRGPLAEPGVDVAEGDYLLEVNGEPLAPSDNPYRLLEGTAGQPTELRIGSSPEGEASRTVTVRPIADEEPLRTHEDWVQKNRRLVDRLSGGRLAYVWLVNIGPHGYFAFQREFFSQLDKEGLIIDVRYNQGGFIDDYMVNTMDQPLMGYLAQREGAVYPVPGSTIFGPRVMLINESAGSGGDSLPYYFRLAGVGPLVGTRTWGGLVGGGPVPETIDGGGISVPSSAFFDAQGRWAIENAGVAPDIVVENTPKEVIEGRDPQLERAVQEALSRIERNPVRQQPRPGPPDRMSIE